MKANYSKEYQARKDKELKLESANESIIKKEKTVNELYKQIDNLYETNSKFE